MGGSRYELLDILHVDPDLIVPAVFYQPVTPRELLPIMEIPYEG